MQDAGKYAELEQLAQARLKTNTTDAEASAALSLALTLVDTVDAKRLEAGANQARLCTEQHPNVAVCHLAAAQNLSMQMINMGMVKAMRSVGTLRDVWIRALELEAAVRNSQPETARIIRVPVAGEAKKWAEMEAELLALKPSRDGAIRLFERARTLTGADDYAIDHRLGDTLLAKGDKAQAIAAYERFIANKRANPANVEDARKSLAKLG